MLTEIKAYKLVLLAYTSVLRSINNNYPSESGTVKDMEQLITILKDMNITADISDFPILQLFETNASPFSCSGFGLNIDHIDITSIPEYIKNKTLAKIFGNYVLLKRDRNIIDFETQRMYTKKILEELAPYFFEEIRNNPKSERAKDFQEFTKNNAEWLKYNSEFHVLQTEMIKRDFGQDFKKWPSQYAQSSTNAVIELVESNQKLISEYIYSQFIIHEQRLKLHAIFKSAGIKLEVNIPFGVDAVASGDVWYYQSKVFDLRYNVGCNLEPHNGYNEQNFGTPQYITGEDTNMYIKKRFKYLSQYADGIFIDHLCGQANKYCFPTEETQVGTIDGKIPVKGHFEYPCDNKYFNASDIDHLNLRYDIKNKIFKYSETNNSLINFRPDIFENTLKEDSSLSDEQKHHLVIKWKETQNNEKMVQNVYKFLKMILKLGLNVGGETLGDVYRQSAVEEAIKRLNKEGHSIPLMHVSMNKNWRGIYENIQKLDEFTEVFSTTHDTPNLNMILTNMRGKERLWFSPYQSANYLSQVFGILISPNKMPLASSSLSRDLGKIILKRLSQASSIKVTIPLQDIFALMFPEEYGDKLDLCINIPGQASSCEINNPGGNFLRRFTYFEKLFNDTEIADLLREISKRDTTIRDFAENMIINNGNWYTQVAGFGNRKEIVYLNPKTNKMELFVNTKNVDPILEILVSNLSMDENVDLIRLPDVYRYKVDPKKSYILVDIYANEEYIRTGHDLLYGLYVKILGKTDHHFIVYPTDT